MYCTYKVVIKSFSNNGTFKVLLYWMAFLVNFVLVDKKLNEFIQIAIRSDTNFINATTYKEIGGFFLKKSIWREISRKY